MKIYVLVKKFNFLEVIKIIPFKKLKDAKDHAERLNKPHKSNLRWSIKVNETITARQEMGDGDFITYDITKLQLL